MPEFPGIRYRIAAEPRGKRGHIVRGTIEAAPELLSAIFDAGEAMIELGSGLGWISFFVTDVDRSKIEILRSINSSRRPTSTDRASD
jgi:hypothetical protein